MITASLSCNPSLVRAQSANDPTSWIRRVCIANGPVETGQAVYGDPVTGRVDVGGTGEFLGIALCSAHAERSFAVLARGMIAGFHVADAPVGQNFFQGEDPEKLSTFVNPGRPEPIATVAHGRQIQDSTPAKGLSILGHVPDVVKPLEGAKS